MAKCPFIDPDFDIGIEEPCPVCGTTGRLGDWNDGDKCVGNVVDTTDELHQILGEALANSSGNRKSEA